MSSFNKSLAALATLALLALVSAKPADFRSDPVDLTTVMNRTVCPIRVEIDLDKTRIPQRIKVMKCATEPLQRCAALGVPAHECCHRRRDGTRLACAEVEDTVEVFYPAQGISQPYRVSVGCTCVIEADTMAEEAVP